MRILVLLLLATRAFAEGPPNSRQGEIENARKQKAPDLKPNRITGAEEKFRRINESDLIGRLLGPAIGLGIRFGGLPTGSGFALGPRYYRPDLAGENVVFKAWAVSSVAKFYQIETSLEMPHLAHDRVTFGLTASRNDSPAIEYYGPGPRSQESSRTSFRREQTDFHIHAGIRPVRRYLTLGLESGATMLNIGPGKRSGIPSTDQVFGPAQAPGIQAQTNLARMGPVVTLDFRYLPFDPHKGGLIEAKYIYYRGLDLDQFSFQRVSGTFEQYIPLLNEKRVIALRGYTEWNLTDRRHLVPFYMQATLGGSEELRGYPRFRFHDDNVMALTSEYRWEVMPALDMALFGDAGQVFSKRNTFKWAEMRGAVGAGFRIKSRNAVVMRLDVGASREGVQVWFKFGHAF